MFCYPDGDEVDHAMRQPGNTITSRRTMALTLMAQNIADMITTLQNWSAPLGHRHASAGEAAGVRSAAQRLVPRLGGPDHRHRVRG
jgi:hypothetical protein